MRKWHIYTSNFHLLRWGDSILEFDDYESTVAFIKSIIHSSFMGEEECAKMSIAKDIVYLKAGDNCINATGLVIAYDVEYDIVRLVRA